MHTVIFLTCQVTIYYTLGLHARDQTHGSNRKGAICKLWSNKILLHSSKYFFNFFFFVL